MERKLKPSLRFKGFAEAWEQCKFKDLAETKRGLTYKPADVSTNGIRVLRSSNINEDYFEQREDDVFVAQNAINIEYAKSKDILITSANGSSRLVGKHAIITNIADNSAVHGGFMLLARTDYPYFLNASMSSRWYEKFINLYVAGGNGAIGNLSKSNLDDYDILAPSVPEKLKVGELFKSIDSLITLHQRKYDKLVNIKKALLDKMFPKNGELVPKIRFKGFADTWEQCELGNLTDLYVGSSFTQELSDDGKFIVMDMGSVSQDGFRIELKRTNFERDMLKKDDLVMPKDDIGGGLIIGKTAHIPTENTHLLGDHVFRLRFIEEDGLFMHYLINSNKVNSSLKKKVTGSAQLGIRGVNVKNEIVNIPSVDEQTQIGHLLKNIDNLITLHQCKHEKLINIKKALLQKMFV